MTVAWSLRRNTDPSLPASHTIEIVFNMPADSLAGGVQNVPGVLMKQAESTRGVPLVVQVFAVFFVLPAYGIKFSAVTSSRDLPVNCIRASRPTCCSSTVNSARMRRDSRM